MVVLIWACRSVLEGNNTWGGAVDVCCKLWGIRQSCLQIFGRSLVVTGPDSCGSLAKRPITCWKDNTSGHKQFTRFLQCIDYNFLMRRSRSKWGDTLLDLVLTEKERLIRDVRAEGSSSHEIGVCGILRWGGKGEGLDFRRALLSVQGFAWKNCRDHPGENRGPRGLISFHPWWGAIHSNEKIKQNQAWLIVDNSFLQWHDWNSGCSLFQL